MQSLVTLFQSLGYQVCAGPELKQDFDKVAIYAKGPEYTHAARQLPDGRWTSKLGQSVRIFRCLALDQDHFEEEGLA